MIILLPHEVDGLVKLEEDLTYDKLQTAIESVSEKFERIVKDSGSRSSFSSMTSSQKWEQKICSASLLLT